MSVSLPTVFTRTYAAIPTATLAVSTTPVADSGLAVTATGQRFRLYITASGLIGSNTSWYFTSGMGLSSAPSAAQVVVESKSNPTTLYQQQNSTSTPNAAQISRNVELFTSMSTTLASTIAVAAEASTAAVLVTDIVWDLIFAASATYTFTPRWTASAAGTMRGRMFYVEALA